ncbi:pilin [Crenobacter cavernae]|uniref:Prepilin-type N-terminal cleavage/methylation domain-containing protein n=1 Tax=Crenobacter cavernae TaxID=2290923 RepID=A0ABY0FGT5_9NEIS|nr:pilin [Crenobacter cavernae]RXZ44600.1 prepilin-type N-terminal cleavage/methylation domain-containing protein [Crenobacter cavernae]
MKKPEQGFTLIELMIVIAIVGILAAMAITAYQDYTKRAYLAEAMGFAGSVKTSVEEYHASKGVWPTSNASAGLPEPDAYRGEAVKALTLVASGSVGVIQITLNDKVQDNAKVWLAPEEDASGSYRWRCGGESTLQRLMPSSCRE